MIAYEDLGPEAVVRLGVKECPLFVIDDIYGNDLYEAGIDAGSTRRVNVTSWYNILIILRKGIMGEIRVAVVGVGNCASSLIQGLNYYSEEDG